LVGGWGRLCFVGSIIAYTTCGFLSGAWGSVVGLGGCNKGVLLSVESALDAMDTVGDLVGMSTAGVCN